MDGIFQRRRKGLGKYGCSKDGHPYVIQSRLSEEFGWKGDVCIFCPYSRKAHIYYSMRKILPLYCIHTLCERHFKLHHPYIYAKAKKHRDTIEGDIIFTPKIEIRTPYIQEQQLRSLHFLHRDKREGEIHSLRHYWKGDRYVDAVRTGSSSRTSDD